MDSLTLSVLLLSSIGIVVVIVVVFYGSRSSSAPMVSRRVTLFVAVLAGIVGVLSAVESWSAKPHQVETRKESPPPEPPPPRAPELQANVKLSSLCAQDPSGSDYAARIRFFPDDSGHDLEANQAQVAADQSKDVAEGDRHRHRKGEWEYTSQRMPGPITVVIARATGPAVTIDSCDIVGKQGDAVTCTGTVTNTKAVPVILDVKWKQPCNTKPP
jgi:hypothetical protein